MITDDADILVVTTAVDEASDAVVKELQDAGARFWRLNTEDFPLRASASWQLDADHVSADWKLDSAVSSFDRVQRVWFRRHRLPALPPAVEPAHAEYCLRESQWFLRGLLFALGQRVPNANWMSHPLAVERAESKILQLSVARTRGLLCPPTLVSNDPIRIREFYYRHEGRVVAKALRSAYLDYGQYQTAAFTTALAVGDLGDAEGLAAAPVIYQKHLEKQCDIRVTVVGNDIYAAAIHSQAEPSAKTDWRQTQEDLGHTAFTLPSTIASATRSLMRDLGLAFGAIDFVLTPEEQFYFLEVNPSGQWLWIEDRLEYPISNRVATWLMTGM